MGWTREKFSRRRYTVEGKGLDEAKRIEIIVKVDGKVHVHVQAREPGLVAFVSRPKDQGFDIELVEAKAGRYVDRMAPSDLEGVAEWQFEALGIPSGE